MHFTSLVKKRKLFRLIADIADENFTFMQYIKTIWLIHPSSNVLVL